MSNMRSAHGAATTYTVRARVRDRARDRVDHLILTLTLTNRIPNPNLSEGEVVAQEGPRGNGLLRRADALPRQEEVLQLRQRLQQRVPTRLRLLLVRRSQ